MGARALGVIAALVTALAGGLAHAGSEPARADQPLQPAAPVAPTGATLLLSIRARTLGLTQEAASEDPLGLQRMKAPTGEGRTTMPSTTTEIARGVYLTVQPTCLPGVDEPFLPPLGRRVIPPARR
jgi:hypothetical protein